MVAFITFEPLVLAGQGEQRAVVVERLAKWGRECGERTWNDPHQESDRRGNRELRPPSSCTPATRGRHAYHPAIYRFQSVTDVRVPGRALPHGKTVLTRRVHVSTHTRGN
jgi:hypothetical protein